MQESTRVVLLELWITDNTRQIMSRRLPAGTRMVLSVERMNRTLLNKYQSVLLTVLWRRGQ